MRRLGRPSAAVVLSEEDRGGSDRWGCRPSTVWALAKRCPGDSMLSLKRAISRDAYQAVKTNLINIKTSR